MNSQEVRMSEKPLRDQSHEYAADVMQREKYGLVGYKELVQAYEAGFNSARNPKLYAQINSWEPK